jgi:hypothetical protein
MITKNDVHTFIIDTDELKPGSHFCQAKFHHQNCGIGPAFIAESMPHESACLVCLKCNVYFTFHDWSFLLAFVEPRQVIYYHEGKILRLIHKNLKLQNLEGIHYEPSTIAVESKNPQDNFYLDQLRMIHGCEFPVRVGNWDDFSVFNCMSCCQKFDFQNFDLLAALINASICSLTTKVETSLGVVTVQPTETNIHKE